jgi:hypothetical protein
MMWRKGKESLFPKWHPVAVVLHVISVSKNPMSLAGLVTLSNFDSLENNNVNIPFASGCQSMWTLPYKEKKKRPQKATVGALDPAMRKYIASDTILFSVPANRFNNMAKNIEKSFAHEKNWLSTIKGFMDVACPDRL